MIDFPTYHSLYDDYKWMAKYGDPLFHRHVARKYTVNVPYIPLWQGISAMHKLCGSNVLQVVRSWWILHSIAQLVKSGKYYAPSFFIFFIGYHFFLSKGGVEKTLNQFMTQCMLLNICSKILMSIPFVQGKHPWSGESNLMIIIKHLIFYLLSSGSNMGSNSAQASGWKGPPFQLCNICRQSPGRKDVGLV